MELLLGAKPLHPFSHLGLQSGPKIVSSSAPGYKPKAQTGAEPPLVSDGGQRRTRQRAPRPASLPAGICV